MAKNNQEDTGFIPYSITSMKNLINSARGNGLSAQTNAGLKQLDTELAGPQQAPQPQQPNYKLDPSTQGLVQLPNGQWVTPQAAQQLEQVLRNRGR